MYFIIDEVDRCIEDNNGNKLLLVIPRDKNKEVLTKYTELWDGIKNLVEKINDNPGESGKGFMKIEFNSDDNLPLNKKPKLHNLNLFFKKTTNIIHKFS